MHMYICAYVRDNQLVNELAREIARVLDGHVVNRERVAAGRPPANAVLLRGCGSCLDVRAI
jgi:2,3-bisphosphoglycerate-independent phosphoglycerate mutase